VKRELLFAVGAATIVVVAAAGCSSEGESSSETTGAASSAAASSSNATTAPGNASASATASAGAAEVTVDGQPQPVNGPVVCETSDNKFSIAIGEPITGVIVGLEPDGSAVHGVGLGTVNGVVLSFTEGVPDNTATATKDGNAYNVSGTATGLDDANPAQQVNKPFEINVTCP